MFFDLFALITFEFFESLELGLEFVFVDFNLAKILPGFVEFSVAHGD